MGDTSGNVDKKTIQSFSEEWSKFDVFSDEEIRKIGDEYFDLVTDEMLNKKSRVLDLGCGTGRWSRYVADRVAQVEAIDPGASIFAASRLLKDKKNVRVTQASSDLIPFADESFDFVMSLGVLHHIPDTQQALNDLICKLKQGGFALLYFYYNFENRSLAFKLLFRISDLLRRMVSRMPGQLKKATCDVIAIVVYLPWVSMARLIKSLGGTSIYKKLPLSYYTGKSFHIMRNDALDRFGTPLEKRFSRQEITQMCQKAGLSDIRFSEKEPYWCLVGRKSVGSSK
jgi:ubiquinone/menaquinone biosynthesis C-methylase UbiE